jgi:tetratricopeptide (TPR) repeat protein
MLKYLWILIFLTACAGHRTATVSDGMASGDEAAVGDQDSDRGADSGAQEEAEEAAPAEPVTDSAYSALGKAMRTKSENAVMQEASKILAKNPKDLKALNAIAVMYIVNRKLEMAKLVLARAIKAYPKNATLACNLGIVHLLDDDIPLAIAEFQRALSLDEGHAEASYHLGAIHLRYKNARAALPLLKTAYSKLPKALVGPHYAEALRLAGQSKDAEEVFSDLKADTSRDPALVLGYASLLVEDLKDKRRGLKMVDRVRLLTEDAAILKRADDLASKGEALH